MLTAENAILAFNHGAPGVRVQFSIDENGILTIDNWEGSDPVPSVAQVETWYAEVSSMKDTTSTNEATIRQQMISGMATLDQHLTILAGAATAAQQKTALIFALKAIKQLARLQLKQLDAVD